jgi:serine/threonine-protein kinase
MIRCARCNLAVPEGAAKCIRCGEVVGEEGTPPVLIDGRYAVETEVGKGSMGVVYKGRDTGLGRTVALKVIAPELARNSTFVERFRREATALASIRNDHVVQIYAMGMHEGAYFYAMEFIEGRNLEAIIREHSEHGTHVPTYRALTILRQVAQGLAAVHATGIIHRDVKPANIVIEDRTGRPVLLDFGLARPVLSRDALRATAAAGSPPYMAPEQIAPDPDNEQISARTDVYALGCTAFELLTGAPPFESEGIYAVLHRHLHEPPPRVSQRRPDLSMLDEVLARALAKDPLQRYESCTAFADALDDATMRWKTAHPTLPPPPDAGSVAPFFLPPRSERPALRVLVVDDDPIFCKVAARAAQLALPDHKVEVTETSSGVKALAACVRAPPHLVVLDYDMPGPNGIDTLSELRALPGAAQATVLVVSASVGAMERWRFSVLGVKDFLAKPVTLRDLVDTIARLTQRTRAAVAPTSPSLPPDAIPTTGNDPAEKKLPVEVFVMLLAVGWADGELGANERDAILDAARSEGLEPEDINILLEMSRHRVELTEVDVAPLDTRDRLFVYAMARWVASFDGEITEHEAALLQVLGFALGLTHQARSSIDSLVRELVPVDQAGIARLDLVGLRRLIASRMTTV